MFSEYEDNPKWTDFWIIFIFIQVFTILGYNFVDFSRSSRRQKSIIYKNLMQNETNLNEDKKQSIRIINGHTHAYWVIVSETVVLRGG